MDASEVAASEFGRIPRSVDVGQAHLATWPEEQRLDVLVPGQVVMTRFDDASAYHAALQATVLSAREDARFRDVKPNRERWACGTKVRNIEDWGTPASALIHARALVLAHCVLDRGPVYADDTWASVFATGDYCMAHSHVRSDVSIVYMLEPGDEHVDKSSGRLVFMDSRLDWCCPLEPGRVTRPLIPEMTPGCMIAFAGELLHSVTPYLGLAPRITLSWNMTRSRLAADTRVPTGRVSRPIP